MRRLVMAALAGALLSIASPAAAGVFTDDLAKCLVSNTHPDDQTAFAQWMFTALALHPAVQPMANISAAQRDDINRKAADLMIRLMTVDCRAQMVAAVKYEGTASIELAFNAMGQAAAMVLMQHPAVVAGLQSFGTKMDRSRLQDVLKEAGMQTDKPAAAPASK